MTRIVHLEDADFSTQHVAELLKTGIPTATVEHFSTRPLLEAAWLNGPKPDAIILDLLVPERWRFVIGVIVGRPSGRIRRFWYGLLRSAVLSYARWQLPAYKQYLLRSTSAGPQTIHTSATTNWGGYEFLRQRAIQGDLGSCRCFVYSLAANETYSAGDKLFGPICQHVMKLVRELNENFGLGIEIFPKGYFITPFAREFTDDSADELVAAVRKALDGGSLGNRQR